MSFYTAPRRPQALAGVVAFSGALLGEETLGREGKSRPPFCIIHGEFDDVVPFGAMGLAQTALAAHGFDVETHGRPGLGHGIDERGMEVTEAF